MPMYQKRFTFGLILVILLIGLMLYYSIDHNNHNPDPQYILDHYEDYFTTKVVFTGEVEKIILINNTLLIHVTSTSERILISTTEPLKTQQGDMIEVYGNFTSRTRMTTENLLINSRLGYDLIFIRSLPAIPFALYLFFRTYRFNPTTYRFERRQRHG